jgi:acyl-CoA synthetase (AMP-forming)/AMP-acid ligase II
MTATIPAGGTVVNDNLLHLHEYTGGTTGTPKGAMLSHHANVFANAAHSAAWAGGLDEGRERVLAGCWRRPEERRISSLASSCTPATPPPWTRRVRLHRRPHQGFDHLLGL